ncbi:26S proteasome non-ATPase regulatory subunit 9 [Phytophthora citrophthora]|uniref:26S proteasome non-ATPase regulatory subunit 9 n=1 Tax=Phytophthora citrophthora TaxID=4793 RepID=A0AAD9LHC6_9STRA|nr:26S proteasome non-ATPase regulatory subunit 9 [Phytophthora citrophthora]
MISVVAEYEAAVQAKEAIEEEIDAVVGELTSGGNPGVNGPLVDAEGFPRADIDVYRVRQLRHTLALKQTDHQLTMKKIETLLPRVFEAKSSKIQAKEVENPVEKTPVSDATERMQQLETEWKQKLHEVKPEERDLLPFAVVDSVQSESPAEMAGLQSQDQVLRFGTADASNHRELAAVRDIVQRNIGSGIRVLVRRQTEILALELTPQTWRGPGVLGCLLQPM